MPDVEQQLAELRARIEVLESRVLADTRLREPWLSKREVAELLGVSTATVERHIEPSYVVGGQNRYLMSEVEEQVRKQRPGGE